MQPTHPAGDCVGRSVVGGAVEGTADVGGCIGDGVNGVVVGGALVGGMLAADGGTALPPPDPTGAGDGWGVQCRRAVRNSPNARNSCGWDVSYPVSSIWLKNWGSLNSSGSGTASSKATMVTLLRLRQRKCALNGGRWQPRSMMALSQWSS